MVAPPSDSTEDSISALEQFLTDNPELQVLEEQVNQFNLFEAIGITRQEIRHSHFLAFLLDPSQSHCLGDRFLKDWLTIVLSSADSPSIRLAEILLADLEDTEVRREWKNIDILCYSRSNNLVIAIENKIDSGEHSNQLERYYKIIENNFPNCQKLYLFLSPNGLEASNSIWLACSYEQIADAIGELLQIRQIPLGQEIEIVLLHYETMLRRHIMQDSQVEELCRKIYRKHRQALDLIFEHRPDQQSEIADFLEQLIVEVSEAYQLGSDNHTKEFIRFSPVEWDSLEGFNCCEGWLDSKRLLSIEWRNMHDELSIILTIGPANEERKRELYDRLRARQVPGIRPRRSFKGPWQSLCEFQVLGCVDYEQLDIPELKEQIQQRWNTFLKQELPILRAAVADCFPLESVEVAQTSD